MSTIERKPMPLGLEPMSEQRAEELALECLRAVVPPEVWNAIPGEHRKASTADVVAVIEARPFAVQATPATIVEVKVSGLKNSLENS